MNLVRILVLAMTLSLLAAPVLQAGEKSGVAGQARVPAAKKKNKKDRKKKKKGAKRSAARKSRPRRQGKVSQKARSHSPVYPTQPGGTGFHDVPNEQKDDLPPPVNTEPTS